MNERVPFPVGIHRKYVLVPADKAANDEVAVWRFHYFNTLKKKLGGTKAYEL